MSLVGVPLNGGYGVIPVCMTLSLVILGDMARGSIRSEDFLCAFVRHMRAIHHDANVNVYLQTAQQEQWTVHKFPHLYETASVERRVHDRKGAVLSLASTFRAHDALVSDCIPQSWPHSSIQGIRFIGMPSWSSMWWPDPEFESIGMCQAFVPVSLRGPDSFWEGDGGAPFIPHTEIETIFLRSCAWWPVIACHFFELITLRSNELL